MENRCRLEPERGERSDVTSLLNDQRARLAPGIEQRGYVVTKRYQVLPPTAPVPAADDVLEMVVREGARKMLQTALELEVDEFLGRRRYQRTGSANVRGYRNGHQPERTIGVGMGAVEVSLPRVSHVPPEVSSDGFHSEIVNRYQRRSRTQARLMARLYLEGLSSGDFEPVFRALVGETAALSPSSILKLKADWQHEYESWKKRPLRGRYVYLYADGVYLKAGTERDKTAMLVVLGVDDQGHKELLAMEEGYRESTESWSEVLRSLQERGLAEAPLLAIGDGALGLWAALDVVFPTTRHQRCWNHRSRKESTCHFSGPDRLPNYGDSGEGRSSTQRSVRGVAAPPQRTAAASCTSGRGPAAGTWGRGDCGAGREGQRDHGAPRRGGVSRRHQALA